MTTSRFVELASILEPGKPRKIDKSAILVDAVRKLAQLRNEAQKLIASNTEIQENIKEMKVIPVPCFFHTIHLLLFYIGLCFLLNGSNKIKNKLKGERVIQVESLFSMHTTS